MDVYGVWARICVRECVHACLCVFRHGGAACVCTRYIPASTSVLWKRFSERTSMGSRGELGAVVVLVIWFLPRTSSVTAAGGWKEEEVNEDALCQRDVFPP